jgi:glycosyltransferase involved in cell wall biosynthesis
MRILISTGIYPPQIGGPAQYAFNLKKSFESMGHAVTVKTFGIERKLPTGIRHIFYFFKILPSVLLSNKIVVLDTFSAGFPTVLLAKIFGRETLLRTGGDFLWERYTERNKKKVLFKDFYNTEQQNFSLYEKIIFWVTKFTLKNASRVIFSTTWQMNIFSNAYDLEPRRLRIIENFYGAKEVSSEPSSKTFLASTRKLVWKNLDMVKKVFDRVRDSYRDVDVFLDELPYESFLNKMKESYAVVLLSLGDISPNMILDAIRLNKPFVCTKENGLMDRIAGVGVYVDPLNEEEIIEAIKYLLIPENYKKEKQKIESFNFTHTWDEIAKDFLQIQ